MTDLHKTANNSHAKSDAWRKCAGQPTYNDLVEILESIMSLVKVHQKHPIIAEKVMQAQQALNSVKGKTDE